MKRMSVIGAVVWLVATSVSALADPINIVGTWKGEATAVHRGANPYRPTEGSEPNLPSQALEFTFVIKQQQGNRFVGTSSSGTKTETIIGALMNDGAGGIMLDDDGQYILNVIDPTTIEACYNHSNPEGKVVACYTLKRQR
ncbi:hypothetical protein [Chelatococcus reniformis]|uniref:TIGR03067 domain-containing protein n=1 Tax=Chelatococcus reniformis TaxID=1494448 RepID=A0A916XFS9_9HYPH|nr:hypothetical protein [Chelatococcus reniformis]GGC70327.1 hypothetical protein GCM10010994_31100 [Chelatococcus reniformis]